ncbi:MAG: GDSL-type esterase/lipase family protein [Desulfobacteraceae bacterium]|nr:GDSL-type esterase/lipase family protein [Desulfobacteraceae bacterium]
MLRVVWYIYLIGLHLLLVLVLVKTDFIPRVGYRFKLITPADPEITQYYSTLVAFHERVDANTPDGAIIFIGDSGIQGLCVSAVANPAVNFGIGSDTTAGVLMRLPKYQSLERAGAVVISIGGNDLRRRGDEEILKNYSAIIAALPPHRPLVFKAILPVDENAQADLPGRNARARELNGRLKTLCETQSQKCLYFDPSSKFADASGNLRRDLHIGDGIHLNAAGYAILITELKEVVQNARSTTANE